METSDYIFNQQDSLYYISFLIGAFFIAIGISWYYKQTQLTEWNNQSTLKKRLHLIAPCLTLVLAVCIYLSTSNERAKYQRIKLYGVETIGTTIKEIRPLKGEATIQYKFTANNKTYISAIGYIYNGEPINNIKVSGGKYKVIYNRNNPTESIMDFKLPKETEE